MSQIETIKDIGKIKDHLEPGTVKDLHSGTAKYRVVPCPLPDCNSKTGFHIYYKESEFRCFACGKTGSIIDIIMYQKSMKFNEAVKYLADYYNIPADSKNSWRPSPEYVRQKIMNEATRYYHEKLFQECGKKVLKYQTEQREHSEKVLRLTQIGYADGKLRSHLQNKKYTIEQIAETGLIKLYQPKDKTKKPFWIDRFPEGGTMYPHMFKGDTLSFTYKFIYNYKGEFIYKIEQPNGSYFTNMPLPKDFTDERWIGYGMDSLLINDDRPVIITEGEDDYLTFLDKAEYNKVFTICGGQKITKAVEVLPQHDQRYMIAVDHDDAGERYTDALGSEFDRQEIPISILAFPEEFNDVDQWLKNLDDPKAAFKKAFTNPDRFVPVGENGKPCPQTGIYISKGCYYMMEQDEKENETHLKLSNFTIRYPIRKKEFVDGKQIVTRMFQLISDTGETSPLTEIKPPQLVINKNWQSFCLEIGEYSFYQPTDKALSNLTQFLFKREPRKTVYVKPHIGYIPDEDIFLVGNGAITRSGKFIEVDENNVTWLSKNKGIQPYEQDGDQALPTVTESESRQETEMLLANFAGHLINNVGTESVIFAIAWFKAVLFADIIGKKFGMFPILFIYGATKSGKNFLIEEFLGKLHGFPRISGANMSQSTIPTLYKSLDFWGNFIVWLDEHTLSKISDKNKVEAYYGALKNIFNRQGRKISIDASNRTRSNKVRGGVLMSGENLPSEPSMNNRCVMTKLNAKSRDESNIDELFEMAEKLHQVLYFWIKDRMSKDYCNNLMKKIDKYLALMKKEGKTGREAKNYAILAPFAEEIYAQAGSKRVKEFKNYLLKEAGNKIQRQQSESIINIFNADLETMLKKSSYVNNNYFAIAPSEPDLLMVWLKEAFTEWKTYRKREQTEINITYREFRDLMAEEPYFAPEKRQPNSPIIFPTFGRKRAVALVYEKKILPEEYHPILKDIESREGILAPQKQANPTLFEEKKS